MSTTPNPIYWREIIAYWPIPTRARWGRKVDENESCLMSWQEAEWEAYKAIRAEMRAWQAKNPDKEIPYVDPDEEQEAFFVKRDGAFEPISEDHHYKAFHIKDGKRFADSMVEAQANWDAAEVVTDYAPPPVVKIEISKREAAKIAKFLDPAKVEPPKAKKLSTPKKEKRPKHDSGTGSMFK